MARQNELRPVIGVTVLGLLALECLRRRLDLEHIPQKLFDVLALTLSGVAAVRLIGLW